MARTKKQETVSDRDIKYINDPDRLRADIEEYFDVCAQKREFADYAGMKIFLELSDDDISDLCDETITGENAAVFRKHFEYAKNKRKSLLVRKMVTDPKAANGCKIALAMPENGGFSERTSADKQDRKITIKQSEEVSELFK